MPDSSNSIFLSQDYHSYLWSFVFPHKFKNVCSSSVKNAIGNLIGISLNLQTALGHTAILRKLILLIQKHGISFHLFVSSLISFNSVLQFSEYRSFPYTGRFIPRCLLHFDAVVNRIISFISLSQISLLIYRDARDFSVLILYPATFPNSLMSSGSFLVAHLGLSMYSITSPINSDNFTSFCPIFLL